VRNLSLIVECFTHGDNSNMEGAGAATNMIVILGARSGTSVLFRCLEKTGFNGDLSSYRRRDNDSEHRQFRLINIRLRKDGNPYSLTAEAKALWMDMLNRGVEILKEPHFVWVWPTWFQIIPEFRNYRYIWMRRGLRDRAYSLLKYQTIQGYEDRSMDKCYKYCRAMDSAIYALISRTPNCLVIEFDDFVNLRGIGAISRFIGRDLDTSLIDAARVSVY
jgi:LPS sulfotransferase NodH